MLSLKTSFILFKQRYKWFALKVNLITEAKARLRAPPLF